MNIQPHIKAVFFDHDDTLVGTIRMKWAHHKHVARTHYGKELSDEELSKHWGMPFPAMLLPLYGTDDTEQALAHNVRYRTDFPKDLFPETIPTLRKLHELGKIVGVVTATSRENFDDDLKLHHIPSELFDYTQTSDETAFHKPDPRVFEPAIRWLAELHIEPSEVLYIGDSLRDLQAALGAGFHFLGVETGIVSAKEFIKAGGTSISHIGELLH